MIVDCHYHLDERLESVAGLLQQMDRHRIDRVALIPAMVDPLPGGPLPRFLAAAVRTALTRGLRPLGIRLYRSMVRSDGNFHMLSTVRRIYGQPDNQTVHDAMRQHPDRFYAWIFVNPRASDPLAEVERRTAQPGWIGVKAHPFWHRYPVAMLDGVAGLCAQLQCPLLLSLGPDRDTGDYRFLPERHPHLKVIYAHAGVPFYRELWEYARRTPNIFVDLSGPHLDERCRREAVRRLGAERCLYGTDGPYLRPDSSGHYDHGRILREIGRLPATERQKQRILGDNLEEMALRRAGAPQGPGSTASSHDGSGTALTPQARPETVESGAGPPGTPP